MSSPVKLRVIWIGKTKDAALAHLVTDYSSRVEKFLPIEIVELKDPRVAEALRMRSEGEKILKLLDTSDRVVGLDPSGKTWTSQDFAAVVARHMREDPRRLTFIIGGYGGLSPEVKKRAEITWSLSSLTFTHDLCRVLLLEQLYRALSIIHRHPYSK
jgi:23S rRNA (pseudouridine1915-N3)-methyltransferase